MLEGLTAGKRRQSRNSIAATAASRSGDRHCVAGAVLLRSDFLQCWW